jgi:hypothetical protein
MVVDKSSLSCNKYWWDKDLAARLNGIAANWPMNIDLPTSRHQI